MYTTEQQHTFFADNLDRHADAVDQLAEQVREWGNTHHPTAKGALGLIERGSMLQRDAEQLYASPLMGRNTKASYRNEASGALGAGGIGNRGTVGYALMHVLYSIETYGPREDLELHQSRTAVKASNMRVHAASCRVISQIARDVASGKYRRIG